MFSLAKFIGLLAAAIFIPVAHGAANPIPAQGLARHEAVDNVNGLMIDHMKIAGRQASVSTVTVTASDCGASSVPSTLTTSATDTATETVLTTISSPSAPPAGSVKSSTTPTPSLSSIVNTVPASSEGSTGTISAPPGPTPTTTATDFTAPSETPITAPPAAGSGSNPSVASSFLSEGSSSSISAPPSPTGPQTSSSPSASTTAGPPNDAGLIKFNVIGALAAVCAAAVAVY